MKNILSAIVLSLVCGFASASPLTNLLNETDSSYVFDHTAGSLTLFENKTEASSDDNTYISTLCASSEVNKIKVYATMGGFTYVSTTDCTL